MSRERRLKLSIVRGAFHSDRKSRHAGKADAGAGRRLPAIIFHYQNWQTKAWSIPSAMRAG